MKTQTEMKQCKATKISLERMKTRSREFRRNGDAPVKRTALPRGMKSLILGAADGRPCPTCGVTMCYDRNPSGFEEPNMATIEHILPIKEGGANESENLIAMCLACNRARGYAYNQARKTSREEIDDVLEWLWMHLNQNRLRHVVDIQLAKFYPNHHHIFERNWLKQYA